MPISACAPLNGFFAVAPIAAWKVRGAAGHSSVMGSSETLTPLMNRLALLLPGFARSAHMNQVSSAGAAAGQMITWPLLPLGSHLTSRVATTIRRVGRAASPAELPNSVYSAGPPAAQRAQPTNVRPLVPTNGL